MEELARVFDALHERSTPIVAGIDLSRHLHEIIPKEVIIGECSDLFLRRFVRWWRASADGLIPIQDPVNKLPYPKGLHERHVYDDYPGIRFACDPPHVAYAIQFSDYEYHRIAHAEIVDGKLTLSKFEIINDGARFT